MEEFWLSGPIKGVSPILMPAAHALLQAERETLDVAADLTDKELWINFNGAPSVGFQLRHIAGSIDRLLTYCRDEQLSVGQLEVLANEKNIENSVTAAILTAKAAKSIGEAINVVRFTKEESLLQPRFVGRKRC